MLSYLFNVAVAGLWAEIWRFGLGFGLIILCLAAAYFSPIWKRDFLWAAGVIGVFMVAFTTGVVVGERRVRLQWNAAELYTQQQSEKAHEDAVRSVRSDRARKPRFRLRDNGDRYNRDRS